MKRASDLTVRNAWLLMTQRGSQLVVGVLFALSVPRLLGVETFGRYALITSAAMWFTLLSGIGAAQTMGRFVPPLAASGDRDALSAFVGNLLALRLLGGVAAAALYFTLTSLWFPELDIVVLALAAVSIMASAVTKPLFALFLGLNLAASWGLGETLHQWLNLVCLLVGFHMAGLRGAFLGLLLADLVVLGVGWRRAVPHLGQSKLRLSRSHFTPYLRFGSLFFLTSVLLATSQRSGDLLVRAISGDYGEVGIFGAANRIFLTVWQVMWHLSMAFSPLLVMLFQQGRSGDLQRWIERLLKGLTVGSVTLFYGVLLLGDDVIPRLLGPDYRRSTGILLALSVALVALALGTAARLRALVCDRPGDALTAAALQFGVFWGTGAALAGRPGGAVACAAILASVTASAVYLTWRLDRVAPLPLRDWALTIVLGAAFLPLAWARALQEPWWNVGLFAVFGAGYATLLYRLRVVTLDELRALWRATRRKPLTDPEAEISP